MVDVRQSVHYANYLKRSGWTVERIGDVNYFIRKFPLIGSVLKIQRPDKIDFNTIDRLCRKYRVFQVILEPSLATGDGALYRDLLLHHGFKLSKSPYLPTKTLQLDLSLSINRLIGSMKKDARQAIKKSYDSPDSHKTNGGYQITNHSYSTPDEITKWREAWKNSVKFDRYVPSAKQLLNLRENFPGSYSLFLASHNVSGRIIGGVLFTRSSHDFAYYWYGFTNAEGRASLSQYSLLYQGILWAKKQGCKVFDFEGVYDPRFPNKSWLGFSHFKRSFGGIEVEYPGTYIKFMLPFGL